MERSPPDSRWRGLLPALLLCTVCSGVAAQTEATDPDVIPFECSGNWEINLNAGTQSCEGIRLRQGSGTLIEAGRATATGLNTSRGYENSRWEFQGGVHIEFDGAILDADTASVVFANGRAQRIDVRGRPARFSHPQRNGNDRYRGRANVIRYEAASGNVRFEGDTHYSVGRYAGTNLQSLVYNLNTGIVGTPGATHFQMAMPDAAPVEFRCSSNWELSLDAGTQSCEGIQLSQGTGTLINAGRATASGLRTQGSGHENSRWEFQDGVHVEHEGMTLDAGAANVLFSGGHPERIEVRTNVHVEREGVVLDADTATAVFSGGPLQRVDVGGQPARFSHQPESGGERRGSANTIHYDAGSGEVQFQGDTRYVDGRGQVTTETLIYSTRDGSTRTPGPTRFEFTLPERRVPTPKTPDRSTAQ